MCYKFHHVIFIHTSRTLRQQQTAMALTAT